DIYDIPIARITQQYLDYLEFMKALNLDIAGEFLVMAATLVKIKSRLLLPRHPEIEGEEAVDPRHDLVQQLLEYKKFKEAAGRLEEKETQQRLMYPRPKGGFEQPDPATVEPPAPEVGLFDLLSAFRHVVDRLDKVDIYNIVGEDITIEERIDFVQARIREHGKLSFFGLFEGQTRRLLVVVTFFALLELIRLGRVVVRQRGLFGEIWIYAPNRTDIEPELKVEYTPPEPKRRALVPAGSAAVPEDVPPAAPADDPPAEAAMPAAGRLVDATAVPDPAGVAPAQVAVALPDEPEPRHEPTVVVPPAAEDTASPGAAAGEPAPQQGSLRTEE
ncbi:MAG: segregation/condensation protein A, partial [Candidatus Edwardsbacteria bacterium]|nr:segregation/condensation protein A [Candidatus Edwardsbacteria bacterium]